MSGGICVASWVVTIILLICVIHHSLSFRHFSCTAKKGAAFPTLPKAYSTLIKINFESEHSTTEVSYAVNGNKSSIEFRSKDRQVRYITLKDQKLVLVISHKKNVLGSPTCEVKKTLAIKEYLEKEDAGPQNIVAETFRSMLEQQKEFNDYGAELENGVLSRIWEGCFPQVNVSFSFAAPMWSHPFNSESISESDIVYLTKAEAQITGSTNIVLTALFSRFDPSAPDISYFQPPEKVYCDGFQTDRVPPSIPDYFSYNAEITVHESPDGKSPIVSYRKVFYDYEDEISRVDFYDPLAESSSVFSPITAQEKSIIHDFNGGVQYDIDPIVGNCKQDVFKSTFSVISALESSKTKILTGKEYFLLANAKLSYNGQFPVREMKADVYTSLQENSRSKSTNVISWYFSSEDTRIVETDKAEKQVLLRMSVRPENGDGKKGEQIIDFYNFAREQPDPSKYDLRSCFNQSFSKVLVFTFPANDLLRGSEKLVGTVIHSAIRNVTGISKQRIYINQVTSDEKYLYAEFDILEAPIPTGESKKPGAILLEDALKKLRQAVSNGEFVTKVSLEKTVVFLRPEPDGLNVFAGDRTRNPSVIGYKEGSVIFLTVGMLLLGFLLGGVTLNLVMSKKFGVSLFQKGRGNNYSGDLNESSM